jgi:hypothetical protein
MPAAIGPIEVTDSQIAEYEATIPLIPKTAV